MVILRMRIGGRSEVVEVSWSLDYGIVCLCTRKQGLVVDSHHDCSVAYGNVDRSWSRRGTFHLYAVLSN